MGVIRSGALTLHMGELEAQGSHGTRRALQHIRGRIDLGIDVAWLQE